MTDPKTVQEKIDDLNKQRSALMNMLEDANLRIIGLYEDLIKAKFEEYSELARIAVDEDLNKLEEERPTNDKG